MDATQVEVEARDHDDEDPNAKRLRSRGDDEQSDDHDDKGEPTSSNAIFLRFNKSQFVADLADSRWSTSHSMILS